MPFDHSVVLGTVTIETKTWLYPINESASRGRLKQETIIPMHVGRGIGELSHRHDLKIALPDIHVEVLEME